MHQECAWAIGFITRLSSFVVFRQNFTNLFFVASFLLKYKIGLFLFLPLYFYRVSLQLNRALCSSAISTFFFYFERDKRCRRTIALRYSSFTCCASSMQPYSPRWFCRWRNGRGTKQVIFGGSLHRECSLSICNSRVKYRVIVICNIIEDARTLIF